MRRKTFDALLTAAGLVLAVVLLAAGGLLAWGSSFVHGQVHDQLAAQKIFFPAAGSEALPAAQFPGLQQYGGQQVLNGVQAEAYADQFIAVHIKTMSGDRSYAELSTISRANPDDAKAKALVDTVFRGETLRGLLLNAYAFDTMGTVAAIGAVVAFAASAILLALSLLGFVHLRRTPQTVLIGAPAVETITA